MLLILLSKRHVYRRLSGYAALLEIERGFIADPAIEPSRNLDISCLGPLWRRE